jgi:hypothetical protein
MSMAQNNARDGFYSSIMRGYIEWLQITFLNENKDFFIEILRFDFEKSRTFWSKKLKGTTHPRIPSMLAFLQIGFKYFLEFCKFHNVLDENLSDIRMKNLVSILEHLAQEHAKLSHEDKPTMKFVRALSDMIASGTVKVQQIGAFSGSDEINKLVIGYCDDKYYYLLSSITYNQVCNFYSKQNENFPTSQNALLKQLAEEGFIETKDGRNTLNHRIDGKQGRYIHFYKDKFDNFEGVSQEEVT